MPLFWISVFLLGLISQSFANEPFIERAFSGAYLYETASGTYLCKKCKEPLFKAEDKYDSGSGWPSFSQAISKNCIYYLMDEKFPKMRYQVLCRKCHSHLGYVFHDGPIPPKHLRYSINSTALFFKKEF